MFITQASLVMVQFWNRISKKSDDEADADGQNNEGMIRAYIDEDQETNLNLVKYAFAYNTSVYESTRRNDVWS